MPGLRLNRWSIPVIAAPPSQVPENAFIDPETSQYFIDPETGEYIIDPAD